MMAKPIRSLELHYEMIQSLIIPIWAQKGSYSSDQDAYVFSAAHNKTETPIPRKGMSQSSKETKQV